MKKIQVYLQYWKEGIAKGEDVHLLEFSPDLVSFHLLYSPHPHSIFSGSSVPRPTSEALPLLIHLRPDIPPDTISAV